jgi:hypothetical protein
MPISVNSEAGTGLSNKVNTVTKAYAVWGLFWPSSIPPDKIENNTVNYITPASSTFFLIHYSLVIEE